jgi:hypothetical protein
MHATTMSCPRSKVGELFNGGQAPASSPHRDTLQALADARKRAERAERRLRSRLLELTWPAALAGIAGGFAAIVGLRLAGL